MSAKCVLICKKMNQQLELVLSETIMDMSSIDFSKCNTVFEDGSYEIHFNCADIKNEDVITIDVCVNGEQIGSITKKDNSCFVEGDTRYKEDNYANQPFLLHYDLIILSFVVSLSDGTSKEFYTDYLLCLSKSQEDVANIQQMLEEIIKFDDSQVGEWLFSHHPNESNSLYEGKWNKRAFKSISSYIQLLEKIIVCYRNNYAYFRTKGKHTIKQSHTMVSYEKVKSVSVDSFKWIMQNSDQLVDVPVTTGIQYKGKDLLPYQIQTTTNNKSWNVYENRIVISFLHTVISNAQQIVLDFNRDILSEEQIIRKIHGRFPKEYQASIITIKSLQISFCRIMRDKLNCAIESLQAIHKKYAMLFDITETMLVSFPRKTSTFCEIKPYSQVFEMIVLWFQYGEYSLEKERLILQVKTLDKLFEYYCLLSLLKMLADNGFQMANISRPVYKYTYVSADNNYINEKDVANTYILNCGNTTVTLYYQPVISAKQFENDLTLFRTTTDLLNYYTPDFVIKFSSNGHDEEYVVLDSKFSSRENIKRYRLQGVIQKYSCEFAAKSDFKAPKMVWILQGRVKRSENAIWKYHNSPLTASFKPITSYGIASVNTGVDIKQRFWSEIKSNISLLK